MTVSQVEIVRRLFDRFAHDSLEGALELISEDFVAVVPPSMSAEPDAYEGHAGARRYFAGFDGLLEDVRFDLLELHDEGSAVMARLRLSGRGVASGIEVEQFAAALVRVTGGRVTRIEAYPDVEAARAALPDW
jgi:ketosteroid isomerase-like protein